MRYIAALFFFFCLKQVSFATDSLKVGHAYRSTTSVKIDGVLAEDDWQKAESHGGFIEFDPTQGLPPSQKTEFKIMYDNSAVYFAAICYDTSPDSILAELGNRDDFDLNADKIRLVLDPYNTRQGGYVFEVYASGVQLDWRFDDEEFDAVWMSAVKKNENGWICEMEIPYSAIRFPNDDIQKWAIQVARSIRRVREYDQWCTTPKSDANPFKYFANLEGIEKINAPLRLSLTPYVSMFADRAPEYDADGKYIYRNSSSYNMGADIKYGIDERFTVDMILLPDFGQVRSDNKIKNIGYQEITFDENRPFFRESSELFNKFGLFYSRRIANTPKGFFGVYDQLNAGEKVVSNPQQGKLINATKLSGRTNGGLGIGLLNAVIDNTYAVVENENGEKRKILTEPFTNFNIVTFDQQLKNNSNFYFTNLNTTHGQGFDDSNVSGFGYSLSNKKNSIRTDGNFALSQLLKTDTSSTNAFQTTLGYKYFIGLQKTGGNFEYGISRTLTNSTYYPADLGFQSIPNIVRNRFYIDYRLLNPYKSLQAANLSISSNYNTDFITKERTNFELQFESFVMRRSFNAYFFGTGIAPLPYKDYYEAREEGRVFNGFRYYYFYFGISTDYRKKFAVDYNNSIPNFIDRYQSFGYNNEIKLRYRFSNKFTTVYEFAFAYDPYSIGFADKQGEDIYFATRRINNYTNSISFRYIFKNNLALNINARHYWGTGDYQNYFILQQNGDLLPTENYTGLNNFSFNAANIDAVFNWQFAPGSDITLTYKYALISDEIVPTIPKFGDNLKSLQNLPNVNSISLKVLYFLDWVYVKKYMKPKSRA